MFPDNTPKEREYYIAKAKGAVCIIQIGDDLENAMNAMTDVLLTMMTGV